VAYLNETQRDIAEHIVEEWKNRLSSSFIEPKTIIKTIICEPVKPALFDNYVLSCVEWRIMGRETARDPENAMRRKATTWVDWWFLIRFACLDYAAIATKSDDCFPTDWNLPKRVLRIEEKKC
jgi:hypothetical protein